MFFQLNRLWIKIDALQKFPVKSFNASSQTMFKNPLENFTCDLYQQILYISMLTIRQANEDTA
jgi:hypothetical protein